MIAIFGDAAKGDGGAAESVGDAWECLEIDTKWVGIATEYFGDEAECNRMAAKCFRDGAK